MSRKVRLTGVKLAALASPHDLSGVGDCCGPVKALPERVADEGAWRCVMVAGSSVDVPKQLPTLGMGMQHCRTPEGLRLYSSLSIMAKDLVRLAVRRA